MQASEKEKQCIEISKSIRAQVVKRLLKEKDAKIFPKLHAIASGIISSLPGINIGHNQKLKASLEKQYFIDDDVSAIKTFQKLWDTKGLSFGNNIEKISCIKAWFVVLYDGKPEQIDDLIKEIQEKRKKQLSAFKKRSPSGHMDFASVENSLPEAIDRKYGDYQPKYLENGEISDSKWRFDTLFELQTELLREKQALLKPKM